MLSDTNTVVGLIKMVEGFNFFDVVGFENSFRIFENPKGVFCGMSEFLGLAILYYVKKICRQF